MMIIDEQIESKPLELLEISVDGDSSHLVSVKEPRKLISSSLRLDEHENEGCGL